MEERSFVAPSAGFYATFLPPGYGDAGNAKTRYPLVVILHGSGSTELKHGKLADHFGRDGVVYVAPRAPYADAETFLDEHTAGFSAWPDFPATWGKFDGSTFPKAEAEALGLERLYADWILASILDARKRYRIREGGAVVVGHSQGGTFAHLFAVAHPEQVKAYVAIAGRHHITDSDRGPGKVLHNHHIVAYVVHSEGDPVVPIQDSRDLVRYLDANQVKNESFFVPGASHRIPPELRAQVRGIVRRECCGGT